MQLSDLTIIAPTRNETANLPALLASLPAEAALIIVDASADGTADLARHLRPRHTTVIRSLFGVTAARQAGADAARTPWLLFTDADVVFASDYFERLAQRPLADVLYGPKLSADGAFPGYYRWFERGQRWAAALGVPAATGSNLLVNPTVFRLAHGFDLDLFVNEDSELAWRIARLGYRVQYAPDLKVYARDHRRLRRGVAAKWAHSLSRCALLYFDLLPRSLRRRDWGYWPQERADDFDPDC